MVAAAAAAAAAAGGGSGESHRAPAAAAAAAAAAGGGSGATHRAPAGHHPPAGPQQLLLLLDQSVEAPKRWLPSWSTRPYTLCGPPLFPLAASVHPLLPANRRGAAGEEGVGGGDQRGHAETDCVNPVGHWAQF